MVALILADADPRVSLLRLSRNFGKELALTAGLDAVTGGAADGTPKYARTPDGSNLPEIAPLSIVTGSFGIGCSTICATLASSQNAEMCTRSSGGSVLQAVVGVADEALARLGRSRRGHARRLAVPHGLQRGHGRAAGETGSGV